MPLILTFAVAGCRPPSVEAVHQWLDAYAVDDHPRMLEHTWSQDRARLAQALEDLGSNPTSTLAMALPPRPVAFELEEIEHKEPGRHTVLTHIEMKNPLAYSAKKVGQDLPGLPKTRPERRRFLSVQEGERWGVKLDLAAAEARVQFAADFERALRRRDLSAAEAMLTKVPTPPDEANALRTRDRMKEALTERLEEVKAKRAKKAADAAPFHCFGWVHGKDFGRDCEESKKACGIARARAKAEHREVQDCAPTDAAVCFESAAGVRCFGDQRTCVEASTLVGAILKICAPSP